MANSNYPSEIDSLPLVNAGVTHIDAEHVNYFNSATKAIETALGENPLSSAHSYTMKGNLLEQFAEFFRIECGEFNYTFTNPPLTNNTTNTTAQGQNCLGTTFGFGLPSPSNFAPVYSSSDFFMPNAATGQQYGPAIKYKNPSLFTGASGTKFVGWATVVSRLPNQENWSSITNSSGAVIQGSLPEPYDWPLPLGVCVKPTIEGIGIWIHAGDGTATWNNRLADSSGAYPFAVNVGQELKIRYMCMEVSWL